MNSEMLFVKLTMDAPLLSARELRTLVLFRCLEQGYVVVTLTLNIPGLLKNTPKSQGFFHHYYYQVNKLLEQQFKLEQRFNWTDPSGVIGYFLLDGKSDSRIVKQLLLNYEESLKVQGQLLDLDVYQRSKTKVGRKQLNYQVRKCFLCNQPAKECAVRQVHSKKELQDFLDQFLVIDSSWNDDLMIVEEQELDEVSFYQDFFNQNQETNKQVLESLQIALAKPDFDDLEQIASLIHLVDQICLILSQQSYNLKKANQTLEQRFLFRYELLRKFSNKSYC